MRCHRRRDFWLHPTTAFPILRRPYGFEVVGLVIPSLGTHVDPSAEHIAAVVDVVREYGVPAVFGETTVSERLARAVAMETGAELVHLYSGSMGAGGQRAVTHTLAWCGPT